MPFIRKLSDILDVVTRVIAIAMASILVIITIYGVISRYFFESPLAWQNEVSVLLFGWMVFIGAAIAFKRREHISLEFLIGALPPKAAHVLAILINLICIVFLAIVVYFGIGIARNTWPQMYYTVDISTAWLYLSFPVSAVIMIIHLIDSTIHLAFARKQAEV